MFGYTTLAEFADEMAISETSARRALAMAGAELTFDPRERDGKGDFRFSRQDAQRAIEVILAASRANILELLQG
jgi:hypothetical protein